MRNTETPNRPEINIRVGSVRAAVWSRMQPRRDGEVMQVKRVVLERTYKNAEGEWKTTNSLDPNDVPKAILALSKAYAYLFRERDVADTAPVETVVG